MKDFHIPNEIHVNNLILLKLFIVVGLWRMIWKLVFTSFSKVFQIYQYNGMVFIKVYLKCCSGLQYLPLKPTI